MSSLNKVLLIGNCVRAPQMKHSPQGHSMANFTLVTNRHWTDQNGQRQSQPEFHPIVCWGKVSEIAQRFLQKGTLAYVEGYLKTRSWESPTGQKMQRTEIQATEIRVIEKGIREKETKPDSALPYRELDMDGNPLTQRSHRSTSEIEEGISTLLQKGNTVSADTTLEQHAFDSSP